MNVQIPDRAGVPVRYEQEIGPILGHLGQIHVMMTEAGLPRSLSHLLELRVSQINGCGFCVDMHTRDARKDGETNERLDHLAAWGSLPDYSEAERAAFAWAEALTYLDRGTNMVTLRARLRSHFSDREISLITTCIGMINLWNRVQISKH